MNDKSALLNQLKINRDATMAPPPRKWPWLLLLALLAGGVAAYLLLKPSAAAEITVATAHLQRGANAAGASVLDASGYVVARRQATVSSKVTGKVIEVLIEEGQHVKAGQVLARIDDSNARAQLALSRSQFEAARAQQAEVRVQLADAERTLTRNRDLAAKGLVSQQLLDTSQANVDALKARLESTERNVTVSEKSAEVQARLLDDTVVRAPFDGVITQKNAQPGEMISPLSAGGAGTRTGIGTLVDMDSLEVEVDVNESYINRVVPGQPASAKLNAYPDWEIPAEVIAMIPTADRSKATVKVRVKFKLRDPRILPDMGVRVTFLAEASRDASQAAAMPKGALIPAAAVLQDGDVSAVFVISNSKAARKLVTLGARQGDEVLVTAGLEAGDQVATSELQKLSDGATVKIKE